MIWVGFQRPEPPAGSRATLAEVRWKAGEGRGLFGVSWLMSGGKLGHPVPPRRGVQYLPVYSLSAKETKGQEGPQEGQLPCPRTRAKGTKYQTVSSR